MNKGFTMIEFLVVISIIGILSSALFFNWRPGEATFALQNSAYKLAQDIREIQEMAMEAKEIDCNGTLTHSFGINFNLNNSMSSYFLFADCNGDWIYNQGTDKPLREVKLEKGVQIQSLSPLPNLLNVVFVPPDPTTYINKQGSDMKGIVTIYLPDYPSKQKIITVNSSGMIEIK
jgi:prepilin-type N-terminal cleavage/methylation domain-containing protein